MWTRCWGCGEKYDGAPVDGERDAKRSEQSAWPDVIKACVLSHVRLFAAAWTVAARLLCLWNLPGKNTGVGCCSLLQGIFPNQGLNQGLVHSRQILYHLSRQKSSDLVVGSCSYNFSLNKLARLSASHEHSRTKDLRRECKKLTREI